MIKHLDFEKPLVELRERIEELVMEAKERWKN